MNDCNGGYVAIDDADVLGSPSGLLQFDLILGVFRLSALRRSYADPIKRKIDEHRTGMEKASTPCRAPQSGPGSLQ